MYIFANKFLFIILVGILLKKIEKSNKRSVRTCVCMWDVWHAAEYVVYECRGV